MPAQTTNYTLGRGKLYVNLFNGSANDTTGERYIGNTPEFSIQIEYETLDHLNSDQGIREKDDSALLEVNRTINFITDNIAEENLALFLLGQIDEITQAATPVVGESLGNVNQDRYYQIGATTANPGGYRNISALTVTLDPGGTPAVLTLDTDYTIDLAKGRIYFTEANAGIDGATEVQVDYTPGASTRKRVKTGASSTVEASLRFVAETSKGNNNDYFFPSVFIRPNGDLSLKGDDWQQISLTAEVSKLSTQEAIYMDGQPILL